MIGQPWLSAPRLRDLPGTASSRNAVPAYQPARSRELEAAFLSPAWTVPLPESPGGVTDPGLPLRLHDALQRTRSALTSHPGLPRGHPRRSAAKTRCPPDQRQPGKPEPLSRSPPGFSPLGINARPKACPLGGLPSETPDSPSLPGGLFGIWPPDHRSGLATFPSARCSVNLLEPYPLCTSPLHVSTGIGWKVAVFGKLYLFCFQSNAECNLWNRCA